MTGEKNRFKTHEQLWKLEDGELSTPLHDELVLQLLNKKNAVKFLQLIGYDESIWKYEYGGDLKYYTEEWDEISYITMDFQKTDELSIVYENAIISLDNNAEAMFNKVMNCVKNDFLFVRSEIPIKTGYNNFIIGYVDVSINMALLCEAWASSQLFSYPTNFGSMPIRIGRPLRIYNESYLNHDKMLLYIEVKPTIKSFGETLRQINTYRSYTEDAIFCIYSPDTTFKAAFENQGIKFITPSDLGLK